MEYASPGAAFSGGIEDFLMKQQAAQLAQRREAREMKIAEDEHNERVAALEEKRQEARERMREKERGDVEKTVANMEPGDIPDAELIENARKHHVPIRLVPPKPVQPAAPEGIAAPEMAGKPDAMQAPGTGVLKAQPQQQAYAGSMKQRQEATKDAEIKDLMQQISTQKPGSPEYQQSVLKYEMLTNKAVPQRASATEGEAVARVDPARRVVQRLVNGEWVDQAGDLPKGTHFLKEPPPKDTSAKDAREAAQLNTVHQQAITELDKWALPIETQKKGVEDLGIMLNAMTPQADALIAPLVLKSTISGTGSGFRMTRPEIENVVGGRSKWESLEAALNKWATDPTKALSITDEQRKELRSLAKEIRKRATEKSRKITDIRHQIDDANDVKTINKLRTKLQEELAADEGDETATGSVPEVGGMFQGGRVLKVTPVK